MISLLSASQLRVEVNVTVKRASLAAEKFVSTSMSANLAMMFYATRIRTVRTLLDLTNVLAKLATRATERTAGFLTFAD